MRETLRIFTSLIFLALPLTAQLSPGKLSSAHSGLEGLSNCTQCHTAGNRVQPTNCLSCHTILKARIDAGKGLHANNNYKNCFDCHSEHHGRKYDLIYFNNGIENFDHRKTGYELKDSHAELQCRDCHKAEFITDKSVFLEKGKVLDRTFLGLKQACATCHTDVHKGELGNQCQDCHGETSWKPAPGFDHNNTSFKLTGLHINLKCIACHSDYGKSNVEPKSISFKVAAFAECSSCHNDPHEGKLGNRCMDCHNTSGFTRLNRGVSFDHDITRFPLRGRHSSLECQVCHKPGTPKRGIEFAECMDCHSDPHRGQFADHSSRGNCADCHSVEGFKPADFTMMDHQSTSFPLEGAHRAIPCFACHMEKEPQILRAGQSPAMNRFNIAAENCTSCHTDIHAGSVDPYMASTQSCLGCHTNDSWTSVRFDHSQTGFALEGQHQNVECSSCHQTDTARARGELVFITAQSSCQDCHEDVHQQQFEQKIVMDGKIIQLTDCSRCHTPEHWAPDLFDHNRDAAFALDGAHKKLDCKVCHKPGAEAANPVVIFKPLEKTCAGCHG